MRINLFKHGSDEFVELLDKNSISYQPLRWPPGTVLAGPQTIEIIAALSGLAIFPSIASVLVQWLKNNASRKITITTEDGKVVSIEGFSLYDVEKLLEQTKSVQAIQTKPDEVVEHQDT